jgi:hypothetical protein
LQEKLLLEVAPLLIDLLVQMLILIFLLLLAKYTVTQELLDSQQKMLQLQ